MDGYSFIPILIFALGFACGFILYPVWMNNNNPPKAT